MKTQNPFRRTIKHCLRLTPQTNAASWRAKVLFGFACWLVLGATNIDGLQAQQGEPPKTSPNQPNAKVLMNQSGRSETRADKCDFSAYSPVSIKFFDSTAIRKRVEPEYPAEAARKGIQGRVSVKALINEKGLVERACAIGGEKALRRAAEEAALQWRFRPGYGLAFSRPKTKLNPQNFAEAYLVVDFNLKKSSNLQTNERAKVVHAVKPAYPPIAAARRISGSVAVDVKINTDGLVTETRLHPGPSILQKAAQEAALGWRFNSVGQDGGVRSVTLAFTFLRISSLNQQDGFRPPYQMTVRWIGTVASSQMLGAQSRRRLISRLNLLVEYQRSQRWEKFYGLLSQNYTEGQSEMEYVRQQQLYYAESRGDRITGFIPRSVSLSTAIPEHDEWTIYGCADVREQRRIVSRYAVVTAWREREDWFFSDIGLVTSVGGSSQRCPYATTVRSVQGKQITKPSLAAR